MSESCRFASRDFSKSLLSPQDQTSSSLPSKSRSIAPSSFPWATEAAARELRSILKQTLRNGAGARNLPKFFSALKASRASPPIPTPDTVVSATVGVVGLPATYKAIEHGKDIALANKEVLVAAGEIVMAAVARHKVALLPVDSEHNAIHQCLRAGENREVKRLVLTASGGPFRKTPALAPRKSDSKAGSRASKLEDGQADHH